MPSKSSTTTHPADTSPWLAHENGEAGHKTGSQEIQEACSGAEGQESWAALIGHWQEQSERPFVSELFPGGSSALLWMLPERCIGGETAELIGKLGSRKAFAKRRGHRRWAETAAAWLDAASVASPSVAHGCECLAWAHALPRLASCLDEQLWRNLLGHLVNIAREACQTAADCDPLLWQLLGGELLLTLAYGLPELSFTQELAPTATATIAAGLDELLDAEGVPSGQLRTSFPALMASWTRSRILASRMDNAAWQKSTCQRYERGLLTMARWNSLSADFCRACESLELKKRSKRLVRLLATGISARAGRTRRKALPPAAMHNEHARLAVLRPTWAAKAPRLTVAYSGREVQLVLDAGGEPILSGQWQLAVSLNGEARELAGDWEHVCWYSDKDVDFLEIEAPLAGGARVERQILLAREDGVLLLADALLSSESARIEYRSSLPLCGNIRFAGAEATREGHLVGQNARALVMPLALPEWQSDHRCGTLQTTGDRLTLAQTHEGQAAYAPLLIDLNKKRARQECTWRQLTVADWRVPQPRDVAVGFRAQAGDQNWLVYRALAGDGIRSLLGQQVKAEFLFGRMTPDGGCKRLLEIEPVEE